jgi:ABC-2 type transport system permease protein
MTQTSEAATGPMTPDTATQALPARRTRPLYWSVRRELWEHAAIYIAPLGAAGVMIAGFLISAVGLPGRRLETLKLDPVKQAHVMGQPYLFGAIAIILTMIIVGVFYCLSAMNNERRDRSILFWKSLPVSDLVTVLAKAIVAMAILPVVTFVVILVEQVLVWLLTTGMLLAAGVSPAVPWTAGDILGGVVVLSYGIVTLTLWLAPAYAWLLMVSAWARRAPFLWAVLPPLALCLLEKIAFNTTHLWGELLNRLFGSYPDAFVVPTKAEFKANGGMPDVDLAHLDPGKFISSPGLYGGLAVAAVFLATTIWLRRRREPI